jgi:YVTN family beta-propeller protein
MVHAYITNTTDGTVSVVDLSTHAVITTITVGTDPYGVAVTPDSTKAYVANGGSTVSVINLLANSVSSTISDSYGAYGVAIAPNGKTAYVANLGPNPGSSTNVSAISVIDVASDTIKASITTPTGLTPKSVALTPDGDTLYVGCYNADAESGIVVIDTADNTITTTITGDVPIDPIGMALTPDGDYLYVTDFDSDGLYAIYVFKTADNTLTTRIGLPSGKSGPTGIAITSDGTTAYVANTGQEGHGPTGTTVSMIDISTNTVTASITVGSDPWGISITPDGSTVYVANSGSGTVSHFPTGTTSPTVSSITVGDQPTALGQFIQPGSNSMTSIYAAPQGRLTLTSNTPVMDSDVTGATNIYYTPYVGNIAPIYDGTNMDSYTFGQLTMALNTSNQTSGNLYDLFVFLSSSVVTIGVGPAWSSAASRGTGAGTTQLEQTDGLWTNANSITLTNGSTTYSSIPAGQATYLGTMYATANGQTGIALEPASASGGTNNILGLWNAYNRVTVAAQSRDSTSSWNYATATWRAADNSNSNRISFVDGLGQSSLRATYSQSISALNSVATAIGINLNSITASPSGSVSESNSSPVNCLVAKNSFYPQLGFNYIQAMEYSSGATATFAGGNTQMLEVQMEI